MRLSQWLYKVGWRRVRQLSLCAMMRPEEIQVSLEASLNGATGLDPGGCIEYHHTRRRILRRCTYLELHFSVGLLDKIWASALDITKSDNGSSRDTRFLKGISQGYH
jgi:hypothetical protein